MALVVRRDALASQICRMTGVRLRENGQCASVIAVESEQASNPI